MATITSTTFTPGTLLWVNVNNIWWPGKVVHPKSAPKKTQHIMNQKRHLAAIVWFETDNKYEIITSMNKVSLYSCSKKMEYVKKGYYLYLKEQKETKSKTFPMKNFLIDVLKFEEEIGGNINIFKEIKTNKTKKTIPQDKLLKNVDDGKDQKDDNSLNHDAIPSCSKMFTGNNDKKLFINIFDEIEKLSIQGDGNPNQSCPTIGGKILAAEVEKLDGKPVQTDNLFAVKRSDEEEQAKQAFIKHIMDDKPLENFYLDNKSDPTNNEVKEDQESNCYLDQLLPSPEWLQKNLPQDGHEGSMKYMEYMKRARDCLPRQPTLSAEDLLIHRNFEECIQGFIRDNPIHICCELMENRLPTDLMPEVEQLHNIDPEVMVPSIPEPALGALQIIGYNPDLED